MARALLNGTAINYHINSGDGPTVVLVHGLATNLAFWYFHIAPLLTRDHCLMMYDLRGHGRSDMPISGYTTASMAEDLHALLEYLDLSRVHLVGHSYGGAISLHYTILHPEHVASLTIADTRLWFIQAAEQMMKQSNAADKGETAHTSAQDLLDDAQGGLLFLESLAKARLNGNIRQGGQEQFLSPFGPARPGPRTAQRWIELLQKTAARREFMDSDGLSAETVATIRTPVLAMYGAKSPCLHSCWTLQRYIPYCRVQIVPRVGHFYPLVRPAVFAHNLRRFIREVTDNARNTRSS
jgi:pimeloyl-ACP methyl ester carboxylesterase